MHGGAKGSGGPRGNRNGNFKHGLWTRESLEMRNTTTSWDAEKVILKDEVLEVRNVEGRLHIARKPRQYDEWDRYVPPYDPYGPGASVSADAFIDD
jgi:hypothetical protein